MSDLQRETDLKRERPPRELLLLRKNKESDATFGIIMAGIAALFIIVAIAAYNFVANTNTAENAPAPPSASAPATIGTRAPTETTASGTREQPVQVAPDKSQKRN